MEEPLLGSRRRLSSSFIPVLSQIPEGSQAINPQIPYVPASSSASFRETLGSPQISHLLASSPASIKDSLIFGSPDANPASRGSWPECLFLFQQSTNNEPQESHLLGRGDRVWTPGNLSKEMSSRQAQAFDDSLLVKSITGERSLANSGKLDLEVRTLTPSFQSPASRPPIGISRASSEPDMERELNETASHCIPNVQKHFHRSYTAPAMTVMGDTAVPRTKDTKSKLQNSMTPGSVVMQAFIGLLLYLLVGVAIYILKSNEFSGSNTHNIVDAIYFCIVTLCTIGYGDIAPTTPFAKIFSCLFVLVGFGFIDILLSSMVNYVLDHQEALLLDSVTGGHHERAKKYLVDIKKGRMRIRMKVALAFGVVVACIGLGTFVMHFLETLGWVDSFYLACMSVTTVGYGDHAFTTLAGRLFASVWLLVSTLAVARSFLYLAESRIDRRHRLIAKRILKEEMTVGDLVAADLDNDGSVSKSDFVVYKLKRMGKIEEKDVAEVCRQFNNLVTEFSGKITLSCLLNLHERSLNSE